MEIGSTGASKLYDAALAAAQPIGGQSKSPALLPVEQSETGFMDAVADVAQNAIDTLSVGEETAKDMMAGKADAQAVVEALAATEMALEMAVSIRDKVVEAYQEILRMPV